MKLLVQFQQVLEKLSLDFFQTIKSEDLLFRTQLLFQREMFYSPFSHLLIYLAKFVSVELLIVAVKFFVVMGLDGSLSGAIWPEIPKFIHKPLVEILQLTILYIVSYRFFHVYFYSLDRWF
jgi:hypothetical protein